MLLDTHTHTHTDTHTLTHTCRVLRGGVSLLELSEMLKSVDCTCWSCRQPRCQVCACMGVCVCACVCVCLCLS